MTLQLNIPKHVAIIMDGNGRWAKQRNQPRMFGHKAGMDAARNTIKHCINRGIEIVTLFTFSSENWQRPGDEVQTIMDLFSMALSREVKKIHESNIQLQVIGNISGFSKKIQTKIEQAENLTKNNTRLKLILAANYGGRWEIAQAAKKMAMAVLNKQLDIEDINKYSFARFLTIPDIPEPDLLIRTSGEKRLSNFLIWQLAYTELYFTDTLWPDFDAHALDHALYFYQKCERRFGATSEQLKQKKTITKEKIIV